MTDVWGWVYEKTHSLREAGEDDLADAIDELPGLAIGANRAAVDATYDIALARARALDEPWVEVFLRHWRLQGLLLHDADVRAATPEAASLIEFSSRLETRDCPQSICAVQDFCIAFGRTDGPGYAAERIEISLDTLARIEPTRSYYGCVTTELVDAYIDAGQPEKALAFLQADGAHIKAGVAAEELATDYHVAAAEIAITRRDWAALVEHGEALLKSWSEPHPVRGRCYVALAQANDADGAVRRRALEGLEPWKDLMSHRWSLHLALQVLLDLLKTGWPADADRALWVGRLRDGCAQLAVDGASSNALTSAIAASAYVAATLGGDAARALLDAVKPELARLKDPARLKGALESARAAVS